MACAFIADNEIFTGKFAAVQAVDVCPVEFAQGRQKCIFQIRLHHAFALFWNPKVLISHGLAVAYGVKVINSFKSSACRVCAT